ncbi:MAG: hypothetical protein ACTSYC_08015 [Promethearchaeota archaeon]
MIKSIFILKGNTGELIFYKSYEEIFNINLTSSFLSAIFSFLKHSLKTEQLSEIEVGPFRFIFEIERINNDELMFSIFCDRTDNLVELRSQLKQIKDQFLRKFDINDLTQDFDGEITKFYEFEHNIHDIIEKKKELIPKDIEKELMDIFNELHSFSNMVISSALLTQTGRIIVSFLHPSILSEIIRLLEGRFISGNYKVKELISLEDFGILSLKGIDENYLAVIIFKSNCPFETSLIITKKFTQRLEKIIL